MRQRPLLVLAERRDEVAHGVVGSWPREPAPIWVAPEDLVGARWRHRVGAAGVVTRMDLPSAGHPQLDLGTVAAVLNRLQRVPAPALPAEADREYGVAERHALLMSVLAALPSVVVNPPSPPSLAGPSLHQLGWLRLAASIGLPTRGVLATTDGRSHQRPGWTAASPDAAEPLATGVPAGARPTLWLEPVEPLGRIWLVGDTVLSERGTGGLDLRPLSGVSRCPLLEAELGQTEDGRAVLLAADPLPPTLPADVLASLVRLLAAGTR